MVLSDIHYIPPYINVILKSIPIDFGIIHHFGISPYIISCPNMFFCLQISQNISADLRILFLTHRFGPLPHLQRAGTKRRWRSRDPRVGWRKEGGNEWTVNGKERNMGCLWEVFFWWILKDFVCSFQMISDDLAVFHHISKRNVGDTERLHCFNCGGYVARFIMFVATSSL